jgi:hypothetical protein
MKDEKGNENSEPLSQQGSTSRNPEGVGEKRARMHNDDGKICSSRSKKWFINGFLARSGKENIWIEEDYRRWQSPPLTFSTHTKLQSQGRKILEKLMELPIPVPAWPHGPPLKHVKIIDDGTGVLNAKPSMTDVIGDLLHAKRNGDHISIINFVLNGPADHNTVETLLKSLILSGDRQDQDEGQALMGALTIPASSCGLGLIDLLPEQIKNCREIIYERRALDNKKRKKMEAFWGSCLVPMGAITGPHTDYGGCAQLIKHIHGRKLWLFWPPTNHNIETYFRKYLSGCMEFSTEEAIEELEGLELILVDRDQTCFIVPGGTIHAVITFTQSCHSGLKLWRTEDFQVTRTINNVQMKVFGDSENLDSTTFNFYTKYFGDLKEEVENWMELREKTADEDIAKNIDTWIPEIKKMFNVFKL